MDRIEALKPAQWCKGLIAVQGSQTASLATRPKTARTSGPLRRLASIPGTFCAG
jgi:hypothetical protein